MAWAWAWRNSSVACVFDQGLAIKAWSQGDVASLVWIHMARWPLTLDIKLALKKMQTQTSPRPWKEERTLFGDMPQYHSHHRGGALSGMRHVSNRADKGAQNHGRHRLSQGCTCGIVIMDFQGSKRSTKWWISHYSGLLREVTVLGKGSLGFPDVRPLASKHLYSWKAIAGKTTSIEPFGSWKALGSCDSCAINQLGSRLAWLPAGIG